MIGGSVERDLGGGLGGEVGELELLDRTDSPEGQADRVARGGAFRERGVEHPAAAEVAQQPVGDLERAAVGADVLAEDNGFGTFGEDLAERGVQCLGLIDRRAGRVLRLPR